MKTYIIKTIILAGIPITGTQVFAAEFPTNNQFGPTQGQLGDGYTSAQDDVNAINDINFTQNATNAAVSSAGTSTSGPSSSTKIYTSEYVIGGTCNCVVKNQDSYQQVGDGGICPPTIAVEKRLYECSVSPGLSGFQNILAEIVRTVVFVTMLLGVFAIVGLGIAWAWAGGEDVKMKSNLKHWGINVLVGLTILFLFRYILTFLAPWIFQ